MNVQGLKPVIAPGMELQYVGGNGSGTQPLCQDFPTVYRIQLAEGESMSPIAVQGNGLLMFNDASQAMFHYRRSGKTLTEEFAPMPGVSANISEGAAFALSGNVDAFLTVMSGTKIVPRDDLTFRPVQPVQKESATPAVEYVASHNSVGFDPHLDPDDYMVRASIAGSFPFSNPPKPQDPNRLSTGIRPAIPNKRHRSISRNDFDDGFRFYGDSTDWVDYDTKRRVELSQPQFTPVLGKGYFVGEWELWSPPLRADILSVQCFPTEKPFAVWDFINHPTGGRTYPFAVISLDGGLQAFAGREASLDAGQAVWSGSTPPELRSATDSFVDALVIGVERV